MADGYVVNVDCAVYRLRDDGAPEYLLIERGADEEHAAGTVGLPGGTVETDPGEAHEDGAIESTARRELREEVAVEVGPLSVVTSGVFEADSGDPCLNVVCLAAHAAGDPYPAAPDEVATVEWYPLDRIERDDAVRGFTRRYVAAAEDARTASRDG